MEDKRTILYPSLLFAILLVLISVTGYLQIRITQRNMENLLLNEGEILFKHVKREIDINLEYLGLLDRSPSLLTPNLLNLMSYDEAIVEDLYTLLHRMDTASVGELPFSRILVLNDEGKIVFRKGNVTVPRSYVQELLWGGKNTIVRMPTAKDRGLLLGVRTKDRVLLLLLDEHELMALRQKFVIKGILDREEKSFNIVGTTIYDARNEPYVAIVENREKNLVLRKPLDSRFLPGYSLEIQISREPADTMLQRTAISFVFMLVLLVFAGALSTYAVFLLEQRHGKKMKEVEKEMELKERLVSLGRLASGMAHEIKNPLNAISMSAQRLKREFTPEKDKDEYYRFIDIMRGELTRVNRIVEEFLTSTRSHVPFVGENLYTIAEELIMVLTEKARTQNMELKNRIAPTLTLECQKERLKQALYNLVLNGMEAMKNGGTVELSAEVKGKNVELLVKDSGPGIRVENIRSIFEYHYTTKDKGMGLGLPISYMIIKDHGGDLKAVSEDGKGATFVITLPLVHVAPAEPARPPGKEEKILS